MPKGQAASGSFNNWSDSTEKRLLLLYGFKAGDWKFIAEKMGPTYSASACMQKYGKLKRAIEAEFGATDTGSKSSNTGKRQAKATNASNKRSKAMADDNEEANGDENEDSDEEPPPKQPKKDSKATKPEPEPVIVKPEFDLFDVDDEDCC